MSEEQNQELAAPEQTNAREQELLNRIEALDRKNKEILEEKKKYQKVDKTIQSLPEGTDVQALIDFKNKVFSNMINFSLIKDAFLLAVKIHNYQEAKKFTKDIDIVFISNVFRTKTHHERNGLGTKKLFELCIFLKNKLNFALGGVNRTNIRRLKNKNLKGFGAISCFRE